MSNKRFYPPAQYELKATIPLASYIEGEWFRPNSPFRKDLAIFKLLRNFFRRLARMLESFFGNKLLIEIPNLELSMFRRETRSLLSHLIATRAIKRWDCGVHNTELATHYVANIVSGDIISDDKKVLVIAEAFYGHGSASDIDSALVIAMAEIIERISASRWSEKNLIQKSVANLKRDGVRHFNRSYFGDLSESDEHKSLGFVSCVDLVGGGEILVPASMVYMYYQAHHVDEPSFLDVSSNGVATQSSREKALLGALYESFERDGFLMYWLNKIVPRRLDPDTVPDDFVKALIKDLRTKNFSLSLLDCRSEYNIPVIVSVLIDEITGVVNVHAAAGVDVLQIVRKLMADTQRIDPDYAPERPSKKPEEMASLNDRMHFWHGGFMREQIDWFVAGSLISFADYSAQFNFPKTPFNELAYIKQQLEKEKSQAYYYEYESDIAKVAGLHVVRAIVPDLVPIFFDERRKHLNVPRLYTFARRMGYKAEDMKSQELNPIPHPFV